ncbi:YrhK family protein [Rhodobacter sp. NTK016B]|uniref:YrhK family protein n=1 Tax=Rhodobacter sp. NTK016B TaxID=2759676 RepID=UPI001A902CFA|nr:YrhK family protein [Rhodobacter sp. NTK016B]MBN8291766.1 YrhK family protein [Rhodobacter sp. NTK016B]
MKLFAPGNRHASADHARIWATYEIAYTMVDFSAAGLFIVGSVLFLWESTVTIGTWMFIVGSICFGLKPTIRLAREIRMVTLGDVEDVAKRLND